MDKAEFVARITPPKEVPTWAKLLYLKGFVLGAILGGVTLSSFTAIYYINKLTP